MSMLANEPVLEELFILRRRFELAHKESIRLTTSTAGLKEDLKVIDSKLKEAQRALNDAIADYKLWEERFVPEKLTGLDWLNPFAHAEINRRNNEQREKYLAPIEKYERIIAQLQKQKEVLQKQLEAQFSANQLAEPNRKEEIQHLLEAKVWQELAKALNANQNPEPIISEVRADLKFNRQRFLWEYLAILWDNDTNKLVQAQRELNAALENQTLSDSFAALAFWVQTGKKQSFKTEFASDIAEPTELKMILLIKALTGNMLSLDMAPDFNSRNLLASILMFTQHERDSQLILEKLSPGQLLPPVRELLICQQINQGNITKAKTTAEVVDNEALASIYPSAQRLAIWQAFFDGSFEQKVSEFYSIAANISAENLLFALSRKVDKRDLEIISPTFDQAYCIINNPNI